MVTPSSFARMVTEHMPGLYPVVDLDPVNERVAPLDLSRDNKLFTPSIYNDMALFTSWIDQQRLLAGARYLVGGYRENREMYRRSELFNKNAAETGLEEEPRSLHLGIDIWAEAGTPVYAPLDGIIHSFAFNNHFGDYGATIVLKHELAGQSFYTLYGHLSLGDLRDLEIGLPIAKGTRFAHFGPPAENGHWPPHLHFQVILDMSGWEGDYPGVCKPSEAQAYCSNSPDPWPLLGLG